MKKLLIGLVFSLLTLVPCYAQQGAKSHRFTIAGPDSAINLVNTAIAYHKLTWVVSGTASVCTVALDTSVNGTTWSAGGAITGQTCTSNGSSSTVNIIANYVRMNMTALTVTAGSSVTVTWDGWTSNPSAGIGGTIAATQVAFGSAANTIAGDSLFTWNSATHSQRVGPTLAGLPAGYVNPTNSALGFALTGQSAAPFPFSVVANGTASGVQLAQGGYIGALATGTSVATGLQTEGIVNPAVPDTVADNSGHDAVQGLYSTGTTFGAGTTVFESGVVGGAFNGGTGTLTNGVSFMAQVGANSGGGGYTNAYGLYVQGVAGSFPGTNNYGVYFENFGSGANNWALYSAGGGSRLNSFAGQTKSILDINNASTATPFGGTDIVRGTGLGSDPFFTGPVLRETIAEDDTPTTHATWNKAGPAGNEFIEYFGTNMGQYIMENHDGTTISTIHWDTGGGMEIVPQSGKTVLIGNGTASSALVVDSSGNTSALQVTSRVATGTAPLVVASTTPVTNLTLSAVSQLPASVVSTGQTNVYGAFLQDFTAGTMEIPEAAGFTTNVNSTIGLDTIANIIHLWTNGADSSVCAATATDTTTTHAMFATAVAGVCNTRAIATGDLPSAISGATYSTATNCSSSASPAVCGSAAAGTVVVAAAATTVVVNTSAVTANSEIFIQYDSSLGTKLGAITCNVVVALPSVTARVATTSFTITVPAAPIANPACYSYHIIN